MSDTARTTHDRRSSVLGVRCARCHRYLVDPSSARKGLTGKWRHNSCANAPRPSHAQFVALASTLMDTQPWPRLQQLRAELVDVLDELQEAPSARVPAQAGAPAVESLPADEQQDDEELRERLVLIRIAIDDERSWKASRLAVEWADPR